MARSANNNSIYLFTCLTTAKYDHNNNNDNNMIIIIIIQFNSFIYVLDNSQKWPITAKHKNTSTG
jgi:hypothetical protein